MLWLVLDSFVNMLWCLGSLYKAPKVQHFDHPLPQHNSDQVWSFQADPKLPNQPLNTSKYA
ncbi:hypothetical protein Hanom_Chr10g00882921 [Helianthus anomalus]